MLSEAEQVEAWFESLSDEQQAAVLRADPDDIPGWMIASLVDASARLGGTDGESDTKDIRAQIPQALGDFIERRRGDASG